MISNVVERLRTQGKLTRADAFWEHGSFWIAGKKYDWYEEYLVFRDAKKRRVICISDQNLENMTKKFRSLGKSPKSVSSNEWATILEILEKPERTGG